MEIFTVAFFKIEKFISHLDILSSFVNVHKFKCVCTHSTLNQSITNYLVVLLLQCTFFLEQQAEINIFNHSLRFMYKLLQLHLFD